MNSFGEFLYALRKEKGLTQAELAELLGVTNKAVSKWETGEAMPETAQLLPISRIFGVTVDELLNGKRNDYTEQKEKSDSTIPEEMKKHLFTRGKDENKKTLPEILCGAICALLVFAGTAAYLIMGAMFGMWTPYWIIIPVSALSCGIIGILFDLCNEKKRKERKSKGENPYVGAVCGLLFLCCVITYLCIGAFLNIWHPTWIIIVVGGLVCGAIGALGEIFTYKKNK